MINAPTASHSLTVRLEIQNKPGMLGKVTSAIGKGGGDIGGIDLVEAGRKEMTRDITFKASRRGPRPGHRRAAATALDGVTVVNVSDRTFLMHLGGKIEVNGRMAVKTRDDLSMAYTPGRGARVHGHPRRSREGLQPHDQAEHGGRRHRRLGGAGPGRHRARGRARRSWKASASSSSPSRGSTRSRSRSPPRTWTRSCDREGDLARSSAGSTWRTSRRRAASRSRSACSATSTSRSSTTTSTAPRW